MNKIRKMFGSSLHQIVGVGSFGGDGNIAVFHDVAHKAHQRENIQLSGFKAFVFQFLFDRVGRGTVSRAGFDRSQDQNLFVHKLDYT